MFNFFKYDENNQFVIKIPKDVLSEAKAYWIACAIFKEDNAEAITILKWLINNAQSKRLIEIARWRLGDFVKQSTLSHWGKQ